ncbi:tRNA (adenosine(37)-N6)-threonylcarbamoyltransferase complex dimerization subunit type 1 TsaB [Oscillospiraceae bacterium CM]|nr:tRNA (adenosine(37)-N6)-threonylcarbamoyltransferase complex dimerization subunit type 1 TsaB [Oscillospiraceae bacterium CM]
MKILAIESSAKAASVALTSGETLIAQYFQNSGLTHSRTLLKMAEALLSDTGIGFDALDGIAVAQGPGSFTGVRIGVAAAVGLALGSDLPVCGVSTLVAMAYQCPDLSHIVCPVMDARRGQVYNALFDGTTGEPKMVCPDRAIVVTDLICEAHSAERPYLFVGDGAVLCAEQFEKAGVLYTLAPPLIRLQTAYGVARAALNKPFISALDLQPSYLRASQAERERREKGLPL